MGAYAFEITRRLEIALDGAELAHLIEELTQEIAFDEGTFFDVIVTQADRKQISHEIPLAQVADLLGGLNWPVVHQIQVANHWIKNMNFKMQWVRRADHSTLSVNGELPGPEFRDRFLKKVGYVLAGRETAVTCGNPTLQERERQFGSMLLSEGIVRLTREPFLAGDFRSALSAATGLLIEKLRKLFKQSLMELEDIRRFFNESTPRILLPDLAGQNLHRELSGLGQLIGGALTLLAPVAEKKNAAPEDPGRVLKYLVLITLLLERLEEASANPAAASSQVQMVRRPAVKKKRAVDQVPSRKAKPKKTGHAKVTPGKKKASSSSRPGRKIQAAGPRLLIKKSARKKTAQRSSR